MPHTEDILFIKVPYLFIKELNHEARISTKEILHEILVEKYNSKSVMLSYPVGLRANQEQMIDVLADCTMVDSYTRKSVDISFF